MKIHQSFALAMFFSLLAGCATQPKGPKLFTGAVLVVKSEGAITVPIDMPKDFVESLRNKVVALSKTELAKRGDLLEVETCAANTMKITQEITSVVMGENSAYKGSLLGIGGTRITNQEIVITTSVKVEDCVSSKILYRRDFDEEGKNPFEILKSLASDAISNAYEHQHKKL
jgi:hypothetical protein